MQAIPSIAEWQQQGHISLWHYKPMPRMYSGWHFAGDATGCENLSQLFKLLLASDYPAHRTLTVTNPLSVGADQIFGEHELQVRYPRKLRICFDPGTPDDQNTLLKNDDRLDVAFGKTWLAEWQSVLPEVGRGDADFSLWFENPLKDPMKRISFWWSPQKR